MTTLYLLKHPRGFLRGYLYKIGITGGSAERRAAQVAESGMKNRPVFSLPFLWGARSLEKRLHRHYKRLNRPGRGSGKTEWFALGWPEAQFLKLELLLRWLAQWVLVLAATWFIVLFFTI